MEKQKDKPEYEKGEFGGKCNRSACLKIPAVFYNHSTEKYYCQECATIINLVNRTDAMKLFGHDLCTIKK